jgi:hypothetical protein
MRLILFAGLAAASAASAAPTLSTDQLIAKHIAARGGAAALSAIKSLDMQGTVRLPGLDAEFAYRERLARPASARIEATIQGLTMVQAYDGAAGWQIQPFQGRKDAEDVSSDDAKSLAEEADFETALIGAASKGARIENLGQEDVDGAPAYVLRATLKNGDVQTFYLDPDAFLTIRTVTRQMIHGAEQISVTDYGDYEKVNGVWFPFDVASGPQGSNQKQQVTYKTVTVNTAAEPSVYARPEVKK